MRSHKHTSLHLSGHTKNSIIARSVTLAKVSTENAFKCGWKCTLAFLRIRNIKVLRVCTHPWPLNQQQMLKSHWKGTETLINAAPALFKQILMQSETPCKQTLHIHLDQCFKTKCFIQPLSFIHTNLWMTREEDPYVDCVSEQDVEWNYNPKGCPTSSLLLLHSTHDLDKCPLTLPCQNEPIE